MAAGNQFNDAVAELYDSHMVPLLFETYAHDLAERVAALKPRSVLETAAGTGVLTYAIAALVPASTSIAATDLNVAMLDRAKRKRPLDNRISWHSADALALPFTAGQFDVVACQFGAMFFPDKTAGFVEARRVLRDGGTFVFNVWDNIEANDFAQTVSEALAAVFPDNPPAFMARVPHGYCDTQQIAADVRRAGFTSLTIEALERQSTAQTAREVATAYCQGTPFRGEIEARDAGRLDEATQAATKLLTRRFGAGPVSARTRAFIVTAHG